jgi:hypothetical protein
MTVRAPPGRATCHVPPKSRIPSPVAAFLAVSPENMYSGWPLRTSWSTPPRRHVVSRPWIVDGLVTVLVRTVTGGHSAKHPLAAVH